MAKLMMDIKPIFRTLILGIASIASFPLSANNAGVNTFDQATLDDLANTLQVHYQVLDNQAQQACRLVEQTECFTAQLRLTFRNSTPANGWSLYFTHLTPIMAVSSEIAQIEHINGDLHRLSLLQPVAAGEVVNVPFTAMFWHVNQSDIVPNMYVDGDNVDARLVVSTQAVIDPNTRINTSQHNSDLNAGSLFLRGADDQLPKADSAWLYDYYTSFPKIPAVAPRVIPALKHAVWSEATVSVANGVDLRALTDEALIPAVNELFNRGIVSNTDGLPMKWQKVSMPAESYSLSISAAGIEVQASTTQGAQYALLTLAQLFNPQTVSLPTGEAQDSPHYAYRGMHIDIARNFPGHTAVYELLDEMFIGKLNRLHLHFADDEGWRIAIEEFPELTEIGAFRCANEDCLLPQLGSGPDKYTTVNGFFNADEYVELLRYAAARNIEVIPSFDTPGHARAAVHAMEARFRRSDDQTYRLIDPQDTTEYASIQYYNDNTINPCLASSYRFVDTVIGRLQVLHETAGAPLKTFHLGADETAGAWIQSPACQSMLGRELNSDDVHHLLGQFVQRVYALTTARGLTLAGWSDGMGTLPDAKRSNNMLATVWTTLAAGGDKVAQAWDRSPAHSVYAFPDVLYFDFPYQNHPHEPGYYWASKNTDVFKVFQFTPQVLPVHQWLWQDRKGHPYRSDNTVIDTVPQGIQGQLWSEVVRSPATLEYMLYPRLYALAERAWATPEWTHDAMQVVAQSGASSQHLVAKQKAAWSSFVAQLSRYHLPRLAKNDINFRIPPPGLRLDDTGLRTAAHYPNLTIEVFHADRWQELSDVIPVTETTRFRSRFPGAAQASRPVCVAACPLDMKRQTL